MTTPSIIWNICLIAFATACVTLSIIGLNRGWKIDEETIRKIEEMDPETARNFLNELDQN